MAAIVPDFEPAIWDRILQRGYAFPGQQLSSRMIRTNINIPYFNVAQRWMPAVLAMYARGRCSLEGWNVTDNFRTIAALEMIAPNLPADCFTTTNEARKIFIRSGLHALCSLGYENSYSTGLGGERPTSNVQEREVICARIPQAVPPDVDTFIRVLLAIQPIPAVGGRPVQPGAITDANYTEPFAEVVALLLDHLASKSTAKGRAMGCNLYTLMYLSLSKRGNVTNAKLASVNAAVAQETNLNCDLEADEIRVCGSVCVRYVSGDNAEAIMTGMATNMNAYSLRLRLLMDQTSRAGMTSYWAIREALRLFATFEWNEVSRFIPDDFVHYQAAVALVGNNEYYGFNTDLGEAKHTRYKSLAWVCIKLLIKFRGAEYGSLQNYRGTVAHPDREQDLQRLIDAYQPNVAPLPWNGLDAFLAQIRQ